ncbi:MAG: radical SAM family heme chaperone HemW [Actinomycetes bacterium]
MPGVLPDGDPAPTDGALPNGARAALTGRPFGFYVHVPFCASRCGYCDFTTYTATELGGGAAQATYADDAIAEIRLARRVLDDAAVPVSTVFFGGGTPTLLPPRDLARMLAAIGDEFGLAPDVEVTTEANPESVDDRSLAALREAGFSRISFGMQSAREHVLAALDRVHTPGRAIAAVAEARRAGFEHVNLDLIYGTPVETAADWHASLDAVVATGVDHVSAYALVVEDGTRMAAQVHRGELAAPDDDVLADRYVVAEETLSAAGYEWYEISNWASGSQARCRHNDGYWRGGNWWGVGPGAHSHVGGVRWWNVRHPSPYADAVRAHASPAAARETLTEGQRDMERVMLELRTRDGIELDLLSGGAQPVARRALGDKLLDPSAYDEGRAVLTLAGRLIADRLVRDLVAEAE